MIVFQLTLLVCSTIDNSPMAYSKTCNWEPAGLYANEGHCGVEGGQQHGKIQHKFSIMMGEKVAIEAHACTAVTVAE